MSWLQLALGGLIVGSIYGTVALSIVLVHRVSGFFHFAHGAIFVIGAYIAYVAVSLNVSLWAASLLGVIGGGFAGAIMDLGVFRRLLQLKASPLILMLASLGLLLVLENLVAMVFGNDMKMFEEDVARSSVDIFGAQVTDLQLWIFTVNVAVWFAFWLLIRHTLFGKSLLAVASERELAYVVGLDVERCRLWVLTMSSGVAALAGILWAFDSSLYPTVGFHALLMGIAAVIVSGIEVPHAAPFGGLLVGLAQHLGVWRLSIQWQDAVVFLILIFFLLLRPQGLFGKPLRTATI